MSERMAQDERNEGGTISAMHLYEDDYVRIKYDSVYTETGADLTVVEGIVTHIIHKAENFLPTFYVDTLEEKDDGEPIVREINGIINPQKMKTQYPGRYIGTVEEITLIEIDADADDYRPADPDPVLEVTISADQPVEKSKTFIKNDIRRLLKDEHKFTGVDVDVEVLE